MNNQQFFTTEEVLGDNTICFTAVGRINTLTAGILQEKLEKALKQEYLKIIINMCQVEYLSSAGIRVLVSIYKKAKSIGRNFYVSNPSENVVNVLGLTALDEMLLKL